MGICQGTDLSKLMATPKKRGVKQQTRVDAPLFGMMSDTQSCLVIVVALDPVSK